MPLTLKIRPLDRRFRTSVYQNKTANGRLRKGEKVCLGKPVEKEGKFNYAVYKVNDANAVVGNLGSITTDDGDLAGEENKSQKLNELDESVWNTLNREAPRPLKESSGSSKEASGSFKEASKEASGSSKEASGSSKEASKESSGSSKEASKESSGSSKEVSKESSGSSKEASKESFGSSKESFGSSKEAPEVDSDESLSVASEESIPSKSVQSTSSEIQTEGSPTSKDMKWFEESDLLDHPKTKKAPLFKGKLRPKSLKFKLQQKNIPVYT